MDGQAFNGFFGRIGLGHHSHAEAQLGRLFQTLLAARGRAHFAGQADLAIGTETRRDFPDLIKLPCMELQRCIVAPTGHPILAVPRLTIEEIAKYPIITYDSRYSGRWKVLKAFADAGLEPKIVMSGIDADVCKTYVGMGLGIGILAGQLG